MGHAVRGSRGAQRPSQNHHPSDEAIAFSFGVDSGSRNSASDPARNAAAPRVLTASFEKIRLTCDFTVSGEMLRARAVRLLERPWLIIARTSRSRAVSASLARLRSCAEPGASIPGIKAAIIESGLIDEFLSMGTGCSPAMTAEAAGARSFHCVPPKMAILVPVVWSNS